MQTIQLDDDLTLTRLVVGPMDNNAYLLATRDGAALLVDAAAEPDRIAELVAGHRVGQLLTTHQHHDHIGALAQTVRLTGAQAVCGRPDAAAIERQTGVSCSEVWTGDSLQLGAHRLDLVGLVGHTPGSVALVVRPQGAPVQLFTGDSLFPGGVGRTGSPRDFTSLLDDVERELFDVFGDDTVVWPGHGEPTTLGQERPHLAEWRSRGW